jgi:hypothetical protein
MLQLDPAHATPAQRLAIEIILLLDSKEPVPSQAEPFESLIIALAAVAGFTPASANLLSERSWPPPPPRPLKPI